MKKLKLDLTGIGDLLSREQMKMVTGGDGDYGYGDYAANVICNSCTTDSECDSLHVCRSSPSCMLSLKVCARPLYC